MSIDPEETGRSVEAGAAEVLDKSDVVGKVVAARIPLGRSMAEA